MQSMTAQQAREYCGQLRTPLQVAEDDSLSFDDEKSFFIQSPAEYRQLAFLSRELSDYAPQGGLLWLHLWYVGAEGVMEVGQQIIENMRKARGDMRSLSAAPAQLFAEGEGLELQSTLMQVLGNGWSGYFIPASASFALGFRTSHRFFCYSDSETQIESLRSKLESWTPKEVHTS
jgi:hypothetical protein